MTVCNFQVFPISCKDLPNQRRSVYQPVLTGVALLILTALSGFLPLSILLTTDFALSTATANPIMATVRRAPIAFNDAIFLISLGPKLMHKLGDFCLKLNENMALGQPEQ